MYQYQVSFGEAIKRAFSKYCVFSGRASRSEYWWFILFVIIISWIIGLPVLFLNFGRILAGAMPEANGFMYISNIWNLAVFLPSLGLMIRRLHDTGRSAWNLLWLLLPIVGEIILIIYLCQDSEPIANRYGSIPNLRS